jgi:ribosomal protein S18 acetylase RimI-like enzyme
MLNKLTFIQLTNLDKLDDLFQLSIEFFTEYSFKDHELFQIGNISKEDIQQYFLGFLASKERKAFLALSGEKIIGYITCYIKEQPSFFKIKALGDISGFIVTKEYRNNGIGKKLFNLVISYFKEHGIKYFTLFTSVNNKLGIEFYKKHKLKELYTTFIGEI